MNTTFMLMGIGNILRRDDGVGPYVAGILNAPGWTSLDCSTAPENFTSVVRHARPDLLVMVDAAQLGLVPGEFRLVPPEKIREAAFGTHALSLARLIEFLRDAAREIRFIGIQPGEVRDGEGLTSEVKAGAVRLVALIRKGCLDDIAIWPDLD